MALEKLKVRIEDLKAGMFVSELDRPWLETPFPFQGFTIQNNEDLRRLERYCKYVYIDVFKSMSVEDGREFAANLPRPERHDELVVRGFTLRKYEKSVDHNEELKAARAAYQAVKGAYEELRRDIENNRKINLLHLQQAVAPMVNSIVRNPDAFTLLANLKRQDTYAYDHAMSCAVLAVALGRHIGFPPAFLKTLAMGGLLFDVGRLRLPPDLVHHPRHLSEEEMTEVRRHVQYAVEIVSACDCAEDAVLEMIANHHERYDGSGYPRGIKGEQIPISARIAGIVDAFDAITSVRPFAPAIAPYEAIVRLYEWRDAEFQGAMIEQFIQVIGVYPAGTIVEMSDGSVGIVVAQHAESRLRPVVMVLLDGDKRFLDEFVEVDLRQATHTTDGAKLDIVRGLPAGAYGIDPVRYFL